MKLILLTALKVMKYILIIAGCILLITGFIHDYDAFTWLGVFIIVIAFLLFGMLKKLLFSGFH